MEDEQLTDKQMINMLAVAVKQLSDEAAISAMQQGVMNCAIAALVRTHPDPKAFVVAFRLLLLRQGSLNEWREDGTPIEASVSESLSILERACPVPLGIRPPGVADEFEK